MSLKEIKVTFIISVISMILCFTSISFAGDNIPSDKEVIYAQKVYQEVKIFDNNESSFLQQIKNTPYTENEKIKNLFIKKFNYTKDYYSKIEAIPPTQKFIPIKNTLLNSIYANLEYLQSVIAELEKGQNIKDINAKTSMKVKSVSSNYEASVNKFMAVIQSWQTVYISKVMPVKKIIQTDNVTSAK